MQPNEQIRAKPVVDRHRRRLFYPNLEVKIAFAEALFNLEVANPRFFLCCYHSAELVFVGDPVVGALAADGHFIEVQGVQALTVFSVDVDALDVFESAELQLEC